MILPIEIFEKELDYFAAISIAKALLKAELISEKEYNKINSAFVKEYNPDFKFAGNELVVCPPEKLGLS